MKRSLVLLALVAFAVILANPVLPSAADDGPELIFKK